MPAATPVLWHFEVSHFNEKARWALDYKGIAHKRRPLLPGLHVLPVLRLTRQNQVPVLVLDGNKPIHDSTRIIEALEEGWPDPPLYPSDRAGRERALELEDFFDEQLGPYVRRAMFYDVLPDSAYSSRMFAGTAGAAWQAIYRAMFPLTRALMRTAMNINAGSAAIAFDKTVAALDRLEREIRPSGYLVGDRFSVADLTAAALLAPVLDAPEFPYPLPHPRPDAYRRFVASFGQREAFTWARHIYARHRGRSAETGA